MGACWFVTEGRGKTAREAFDDAVAAAQWECGHGGYTGTIAEKHAFVMIALPEGSAGISAAYAYANSLADDPRVHDKWGPAGCLRVGDGKYLFFGYASS